jgi:Do/DeqQ family serine protease
MNLVPIKAMARFGQIACLLTVSAFAAAPAAANSKAAQQAGLPSLAPMLELTTPAVVNIRVTKTVPTSSPQFSFGGEDVPDEIRRYFESRPDLLPRNRQQPYATGAGSGVIIDAGQGYVITNHHVVEGANTISVQLSDQRVIEASLIGSDARTDVALLKIDAQGLSELKLANIDTVQVGDYVVAIGNPFGIGQTVTSGIVSALGRSGLNNENYEDFIQTDAAINMGNSGGALVDLEGNLVGINTAIISGNGGSNGIGFAVPADMVASVVEHLERDGEVKRGMLGVTIATANPEITGALGVGLDSGAIVTSVLADSAAEQAGIEVSDIIVEIDGHKIASSRELRNTVALIRQGDEIDLVLYRDGQKRTLNAVIGGADGNAIAAVSPSGGSAFRGAQLRALAGNGDVYGDRGLLIESVQPRSPAAAAGLVEGDIIVQVNRTAVTTMAEFNAAVEGAERFSALTILREGRQMLLFVP